MSRTKGRTVRTNSSWLWLVLAGSSSFWDIVRVPVGKLGYEGQNQSLLLTFFLLHRLRAFPSLPTYRITTCFIHCGASKQWVSSCFLFFAVVSAGPLRTTKCKYRRPLREADHHIAPY